ncbi:MAG: Crp/Fnr family transcriptional regulator [Gemmatimonadota bacterium]
MTPPEAASIVHADTSTFTAEASLPLSSLAVLRRVPFFAGLPDEELAAIAELVREREYPKGSVILFAADQGDSLYLVAAGEVKVVLIGEDGREVVLSVMGEGNFFGEMSLLDDEPRSAHVIALQDTRLLLLRREDFRSRLRASPDLAIALLRELSRRLRRADDRIGSLVLLDVGGRVADQLLQAADEGDGVVIARRLTHHLIGQMIGASRETVSRTMRDFVERGLIKVSRREITLLDRKALETTAQRT